MSLRAIKISTVDNEDHFVREQRIFLLPSILEASYESRVKKSEKDKAHATEEENLK